MLAYLRFGLAATFTFRHTREPLRPRKDFATGRIENSSTASTGMIETGGAGSARVSAA